MLAEEQKLRWCGFDMRPRGRRRVAVLATYTALFVISIVASEYVNHPVWAIVGLIVVTGAVTWLSVMRTNGIVKDFVPKPPMRIKGIGEVVFVEGLDGWAKHFYSAASFDEATPSQREEILSRFKPGKRLFPVKEDSSDTPWLDEREVKERDAAERWSRQKMTNVLGIYMGLYLTHAIYQETVRPLTVAVQLFMLSVLAQTLPQARVLWTEDDPREGLGEMHLVDAT
ncbi:MAG TPA: hypothetical protein VIM67_10770 [Terriglobus sp.]